MNKKIIPIFFASDDNYVPYLEVSIKSLIQNASKKHNYEINILNTGLTNENKNILKSLENENTKILLQDISSKIDTIKSKLKDVYHFSVIMYYRLFIPSLFPQYDKILYLDCDIAVVDDISKLFKTKLGNKLVGACADKIVASQKFFRSYVENAVGIKSYKKYFSSGVLLMNLKQFRKNHIEENFIYLINKYNFDVVAPDQDYLNFLCRNKVKFVDGRWNKQSLPNNTKGKTSIAHYALYKKPWQYDNVLNDEYFWQYANQCKSYEKIINAKQSFSNEQKLLKEKANIDIVAQAEKIMKSNFNFKNTLLNENKKYDFSSYLELKYNHKHKVNV